MTYWIGEVPMYDDFGLPIGKTFIDGRTKSGRWAFMQPKSFAKHGVGLGVGNGQKYEKQEDGKWLKTEG